MSSSLASVTASPSTPISESPGVAAPSALDAAAAQKPGVISVMCPMGFTPYAVEGLTLAQPLFARVTYRPA